MAGRQAASTEQAVKAYMPGADVYALARKFGVSTSNLYRALKKQGFKFKRNGR